MNCSQARFAGCFGCSEFCPGQRTVHAHGTCRRWILAITRQRGPDAVALVRPACQQCSSCWGADSGCGVEAMKEGRVRRSCQIVHVRRQRAETRRVLAVVAVVVDLGPLHPAGGRVVDEVSDALEEEEGREKEEEPEAGEEEEEAEL